MARTTSKSAGERRRRLSREAVLRAAVELADEQGLGAVSMRKLGDLLGVVPMALYNHVANKQELLDGMIDTVVAEIEPPTGAGLWKSAVRDRVLSARQVMLRHPWAPQLVLESSTTRTPAVLAYMETMAATFRNAGFSIDLTHYVMHAIGRRMWGFSHELFPYSDDLDAAGPRITVSELAETHPYLAEIATATDTGRDCDPQKEFEFTLDVLLDGFERLHRQHWTSST